MKRIAGLIIIIVIFCISCSDNSVLVQNSASVTGSVRLHSNVSHPSFAPQSTKITVYPFEISTFADSSGNFTVSDIPAENCWIIAENGTLKARMINITLSEGQTTNVYSIALENPGMLSASVITNTGSASMLTLDNYGEFTADAYGKFSISGIPAGSYQATVSNPLCSHIIIPELQIKPGNTTEIPTVYLAQQNSSLANAWEHLHENLTDEAEAEFKKLIKNRSGRELKDAYTGLGWTYLIQKKYDTALEMLENGSCDNDTRFALASLYMCEPDITRAQKAVSLLDEIYFSTNKTYIFSEHNLHIPVHKVTALKCIAYFITEDPRFGDTIKFLKTLSYDYRSYSIIGELEF